MIQILKSLVLGLALFLFSAGVFAAEKATAEDAIALVKNGIAYYKENGKEKSLAAFNDPNGPFVKGELYFFVYSTNGDGIVLAHGQNQRMVGKYLLDVKDNDGVMMIRDAMKIANSPAGKGWISYNWPNSVTGKIEAKRTYIERVGDIWIGCGIYK